MILTEGVKYIGSKNKLNDYIVARVSELIGIETILDGFAGTTRVGQALRKCNYTVISNDLSDYTFAFSKCYLETTESSVDLEEANSILIHLNKLDGEEGLLTKHYSGGSTSYKRGELMQNDIMFWQRKNTMKADRIRREIEKYRDDEHLYFVLLTSLMLAMDKVDNTVGVQQAFLKNSWAKRSFNDLTLMLPEIPISYPRGKAFQKDVNELVQEIEVDLAYYDPPYTSHNYSSYYHIWDTVVVNEIGEVSGITNRPAEVRKSDYNYKRTAEKSFRDLILNTNSKHVLISYNNEGIIPFGSLMDMASDFGKCSVTEVDYKRNVMSQIGIYNSDGEPVGSPGKQRNIEYLILASR
jgi:adenine-specific DNA-methyltransferase